jgi:hypothetical protein
VAAPAPPANGIEVRKDGGFTGAPFRKVCATCHTSRKTVRYCRIVMGHTGADWSEKRPAEESQAAQQAQARRALEDLERKWSCSWCQVRRGHAAMTSLAWAAGCRVLLVPGWRFSDAVGARAGCCHLCCTPAAAAVQPGACQRSLPRAKGAGDGESSGHASQSQILLRGCARHVPATSSGADLHGT